MPCALPNKWVSDYLTHWKAQAGIDNRGLEGCEAGGKSRGKRGKNAQHEALDYSRQLYVSYSGSIQQGQSQGGLAPRAFVQSLPFTLHRAATTWNWLGFSLNPKPKRRGRSLPNVDILTACIPNLVDADRPMWHLHHMWIWFSTGWRRSQAKQHYKEEEADWNTWWSKSMARHVVAEEEEDLPV